MPTTVAIPPTFQRQLRSQNKKYPQVSNEVRLLIGKLQNDERPGQSVPGTGYEVFKVRLPNRAARRGKSGGFRIIYYLRLANQAVLLTIYSKTEQADISTYEIQQLIKQVSP